MFQSLLSWISARRRRLAGGDVATLIEVSILVVVDQRSSACAQIGDCEDTTSVFQSLLSWISARRRSADRVRRLGSPMFQSLLSWISARRPRPPADGASASRLVSILVVVDSARRHSRRRLRRWHPTLVSILVVVDQPLRRILIGSILVSESARATSVRLSFNPCCRGSASSAILLAEQRSMRDAVSILVVVDQPLRRLVTCVPDVLAMLSFNPCCRGSASSARMLGSHGDSDRVSILVVVDQPLRPAADRRTGHGPGFNPCCRGSASSATVMRRWTCCRGIVFQSLLSWISLFGATLRHDRIVADVSILVVMDHASRNDLLVRACANACFNPCCRGSALFGDLPPMRDLAGMRFQSLLSWITLFRSACSSHWRAHGVSILVVVDHARRHRDADARHRLRSGFQSLLSWITPLRLVEADTASRRRHDGVSILVVMDHASSSHVRRCGHALTMRCFNPCCHGSRLVDGI